MSLEVGRGYRPSTATTRDTASALAAGCPVVIKAHPAHPQTSQLTFDIALEFLQQAGAPRGVIGLGHGFEFGKAIINDPRITAGAFTGSRQGGRALFDMAQTREVPIPFYGELGSVNPVVVLQSALSDPKVFAGAYLDSLLMGNGQFCTNPSLLFIPASGTLIKEISEELIAREPAPFLSQATKELHDKNRASLLQRTKATVIPGKSAPEVGFYSAPEILLVAASDVAENPEQLSIECFGPTGVLITYTDIKEVLDILGGLEGALAGSLFSSTDDPAAHSLSMALADITGRVALNAWPTGVSVTPGQHHGGPYPASTSPLHTSVGINAITRFLRPVTFQGFPADLLNNDVVKASKGE